MICNVFLSNADATDLNEAKQVHFLGISSKGLATRLDSNHLLRVKISERGGESTRTGRNFHWSGKFVKLEWPISFVKPQKNRRVDDV